VHKLNQLQVENQVSAFDETRISINKEIVITKPVKISHLTNSILLPFLPSKSGESGEVWSTSATGGSGVYSWQMLDPKVATVHGSAQVRSVAIGKTELVVRDHRNYFNWASISVEVTNVHSFSWVEEQLEMQAAEGDKQGALGE
jgi:hypothetical protein